MLDYVCYFYFKGIKYKMLYNVGLDINVIIDLEYECEYLKKIMWYLDYKKIDFVIIIIFYKFILNKYNWNLF